uniref:glycosyltransferase n=1 Tax=Escherichia coli TaxID=562 RepID=UPI003F7FEA83
KLDHPRVVLEALSCGTHVVVGPAPTMDELLVSPGVTRVEGAEDLARALGAALRHAPDGTVDPVTRALLDARAPDVVARAYLDAYA